MILAIDNDGRYTVRHHADDSTHKGTRRSLLCIESAFEHPSAADIANLTTADRPEDTALLMRRNADGRRRRLRATENTLRPQDTADIPAQFWPLLPHFRQKAIPASEERVQQSDYSNMLAADGSPKPMEWVEWQRKMGDIAKGKAPGYSGNTPDFYAPHRGLAQGSNIDRNRPHAARLEHDASARRCEPRLPSGPHNGQLHPPTAPGCGALRGDQSTLRCPT